MLSQQNPQTLSNAETNSLTNEELIYFNTIVAKLKAAFFKGNASLVNKILSDEKNMQIKKHVLEEVTKEDFEILLNASYKPSWEFAGWGSVIGPVSPNYRYEYDERGRLVMQLERIPHVDSPRQVYINLNAHREQVGLPVLHSERIHEFLMPLELDATEKSAASSPVEKTAKLHPHHKLNSKQPHLKFSYFDAEMSKHLSKFKSNISAKTIKDAPVEEDYMLVERSRKSATCVSVAQCKSKRATPRKIYNEQLEILGIFNTADKKQTPSKSGKIFSFCSSLDTFQPALMPEQDEKETDPSTYRKSS